MRVNQRCDANWQKISCFFLQLKDWLLQISGVHFVSHHNHAVECGVYCDGSDEDRTYNPRKVIADTSRRLNKRRNLKRFVWFLRFACTSQKSHVGPTTSEMRELMLVLISGGTEHSSWYSRICLIRHLKGIRKKWRIRRSDELRKQVKTLIEARILYHSNS